MNQVNITPRDTTKPGDLKTFYRYVRSKIIAKRVETILTTTSWKILFSKREHFTCVNSDDTASNDGPPMLQILIVSVNHFTRNRVSDLKTSIHTTKINQFQYNVVDMCDKIMVDYEMINA